jgi:hypothetical protein
MALMQPSGLSGEESESAVALAVNAELHLRQSPAARTLARPGFFI